MIDLPQRDNRMTVCERALFGMGFGAIYPDEIHLVPMPGPRIAPETAVGLVS